MDVPRFNAYIKGSPYEKIFVLLVDFRTEKLIAKPLQMRGSRVNIMGWSKKAEIMLDNDLILLAILGYESNKLRKFLFFDIEDSKDSLGT